MYVRSRMYIWVFCVKNIRQRESFMAETGKSKRILGIQQRLMYGEVLNKSQLAKEYSADPRSIQRDIDEIRAFYSNEVTEGNLIYDVVYDRLKKGFKLEKKSDKVLTNAEIFTIIKILLDSRVLGKDEVEDIVLKLLNVCLPQSEKKIVRDQIENELWNYTEPRHHRKLIDSVWEICNIIHEHRIVELEYIKSNGELTKAKIKPVGLTVSEFYFYLIAYVGDADKEYLGYPTIYRVDRIEKFKICKEKFSIPYKNRFEEGEFKKRIPFMYSGKLQKKKFIYKGPDINAVLDRLPTAEAYKLNDGSWKVTVEVYGEKGLDMWLRSQGENVEF